MGCPKESFQSHAGSIEAREARERSRGRAMFQSHAGSIEAGTRRVCATRTIRFNPTLVRLRRSTG